MDKTFLFNLLMVVHSFEVKKLFRSCKNDKYLLGPKILYHNVFGALIYLVSCIPLDIAFCVNLLARYTFILTRRY